MADIVLPAERAQYAATIDGILASADLQTISSKQIRRGLVAKFGVELGDKKVCFCLFLCSSFSLRVWVGMGVRGRREGGMD